MTQFHTDLSISRWNSFSFVEQMANIGSEVIRTLQWRSKGNKEYSKKSFYRALELIDLTLQTPLPVHRLQEIARLRSVLVDDIEGNNTFQSTDRLWNSYFLAFTYAAARARHTEGVPTAASSATAPAPAAKTTQTRYF